MSFLEQVLEHPSYGFTRNGKFYKPTTREIFSEFVSRVNIFSSRKKWLPFFAWASTLVIALPFGMFWFHYVNIPLLAIAFVYSMIILGSHGTFWLHRYSTHRAFKFRNPWVAMICRNLVIKLIPEEVYVVSHRVHHAIPELPGDPYNVAGGWLYCFLSDANHQSIRKDLSEKDYEHVRAMLNHTGVRLNSYKQYQYWGSITHPFFAFGHYALNWSFWYGVFYLLGGHPLANTMFAAAGTWAIGVRTFNYEGHGKGKDRRREGIDFNWADLSVNQMWPGYVAGEWHNNHHLYPSGARSGFLPYQIDLPWYFIRLLSRMGWVTSYRDYREDFMRDHYEKYMNKKLVTPSLRTPTLS